MTDQSTDRELAQEILLTLKNLADEGRKLTEENLIEALRRCRLPRSGGDVGPDRDLGRAKSKREDFYHLALVTIMDIADEMCSVEHADVFGPFKKDLLRHAKLSQLEVDLQSVIMESEKVAAGKGFPRPGSSSPQISGKAASGPDRRTWLNQLRRVYLSLLEGFDQDLGEDYNQRVTSLRQRITQTNDPDYLTSLHPELQAVARFFAHQTYKDSQQAARFMAEVAGQLADLSKIVEASVGHVVGLHKSNTDFAKDLGRQMEEMSSSTEKAKQLKEFKRLVLNRIESLKSSIHEKQVEDERLIRGAYNELDVLQTELARVKKEALIAENEKRELAAKIRLDPLTGAHNRMALEERLHSDLSLLQRHNRLFSMAMIDIDFFKKVNDTFGHTIGDRCLQELVNRIKPAIRKSDFLARYGGEEFALVLAETDMGKALEVAEKIRSRIAGTNFLVRGKPIKVTISLGVTQATPQDLDPEAIINRADKALYQAKQNGRNRVESE